MKYDRLKEILIHPAFISFILWLVVILILPPLFPKYRIKQISENSTYSGVGFIYSDLDSDGTSEQISVDLNDKERTKIIISKDFYVLDQYNIRFQPVNLSYLFTIDYNHDGYLELYVFTVSEDSIFLNIIDPIISRTIMVANRFIDHWQKGAFSTSRPFINKIGALKNKNNNDDLIFFVTTGFSLQPRNVYRYNIDEDTLIKSPRSGATIHNCKLADITNDGLPEILLDINATGNQADSFPFTDRYTWVMVLQQDLSFLFPPVSLTPEPSRTFILPINQNNETRLIVFNDYFGSENLSSAFYLFDRNGSKIRENPIQESDNDYFRDISHAFTRIFPATDQNTVAFYFLKNHNTEIVEMDTSLMPVNSIKIPAIDGNEPFAIIDADMDGQTEYFFQGSGGKNLIIVKDNFRNAVAFPVNVTSDIKNPLYISSVFREGIKPQVYIQFDEIGMSIQYSSNPLFYFRYLFYAAVYLTIFAFIILISRIQQYRLTQKQLTEKKIASLQMKSIKNQIDPHFTLNVLNAIGSLYAAEKNREKADYIFGKYARLIRDTVVSSDQIIVTLAEELDFVKNYIEIEQFRNDYSFDYRIDIDNRVDRNMRIPRMLVHTFVENAIKYGVKTKNENGLLKIEIKKSFNKCMIIVEDNGPGIDTRREPQSGTGKGLTILDELIDLYFRLEKSKITYSLENIPGEGETIAGTKALIELYC